MKDFHTVAVISIPLVEHSIPTCTCSLFNHKFIPCRHLICYFTCNGISEVPSRMILNRWKVRDKMVHGIG